MNEPKLDIKYSEITTRMKSRFVKAGLLQSSKFSDYLAEIDEKFNAYREVFKEFLTRDWERLFPGVAYSEQRLEERLESYLDEKRTKAVADIKWQIEREKALKIFMGYVFGLQQLKLLLALGVSVLLIPLFIFMIAYPSDITLLIGIVGIIALPIVNLYIARMYHKSVN